jgi:hypothetical protein
MNTSDELERLNKLHKDGALSDDEFAQAKRKLLNQSEEPQPIPPPDRRAEGTANRDFTFQTVMIVLVVVLLVIFLVGVVPHWHHMHWNH